MKLRDLKFNDEQACIADMNALRQGHQAGGKWSLAQACWHCAWPLKQSLHAPKSIRPSVDQKSSQAFMDQVIATGWPAERLDASREMTPPKDAGPEAIDEFISMLDRLANYPASHVDAHVFGPVDLARYRGFVLVHAAHHLNFFRPGRELRYPDTAAIADDVARLRKGHAQSGNWTLQQACWHLGRAIERMLSRKVGTVSPTPAKPEALARVLSTGKLPGGLQAPEGIVPPATASDADIEAFLLSVRKLDGALYPVDHSILGPVTAEQFRPLALIHCAHHLSHFRPTDKKD